MSDAGHNPPTTLSGTENNACNPKSRPGEEPAVPAPTGAVPAKEARAV